MFQLCILTISVCKEGDIDIFKLFKIVPILEKIQTNMDFVPIKLQELHKVLSDEETPKIEIGKHCNKPYECDFKGHCWNKVTKYSVLNISRLKADTKWDLYNSGYINIKDVPLEIKMSAIKADSSIIVKYNTEVHYIKEKNKDFFDNLSDDIFHLDFEWTVGLDIPVNEWIKTLSTNSFSIFITS